MNLALRFINSLSVDTDLQNQLGLERCIVIDESSWSSISLRGNRIVYYKIDLSFTNLLSNDFFDHNIYKNLNKCYKHNLDIVFSILDNLLEPFQIRKSIVSGNYKKHKNYRCYVNFDEDLIFENDFYSSKYVLDGCNDQEIQKDFFITDYSEIPYLNKIKHYNYLPYYYISKKSRSRDTGTAKWRNDVIKRDGACIKCGSTHRLEAHHINSYKDYPHFRLDVSNGATLCHECHKKFHSKYGINNVNDFTFNEFLNYY